MSLKNASALTAEEIQRNRQRLSDLRTHLERLKAQTKATASSPVKL
jgi:hypothetical protein